MREFHNILIINGGIGPTPRYRCYHKQEQFKRHGVKSLIVDYEDRAAFSDVSPFDLVILHRVPIDDSIQSLIQRIHSLGRRVVFDTDDLVFDPEAIPWVRALETMSEDEVKLYADGVRRYRATLDLCDFAFASTDFLAKRLQQIGKPTAVVRNSLSEELIRLSDEARRRAVRDGNVVVLGYFSGTNTHDRDFQEAADGILNILHDLPHVRLMLVGPLKVDSRFDAFQDRIRRFDLVRWQRLPELIAQADINLAPLEQGNPYCEAKSELKFFEAALAGVPTMASATEAFSCVIRHGHNGMLVGQREDWEACLRSLVLNPELRATMAENARQHALENYSPEVRSKELMDSVEIAQEWRSPSMSTSGVQPSRRLTINWVLGEPIKGSGGYNSIFQMATRLSRLGHRNRLYFRPENLLLGATTDKFAKFVRENFFDVEAEIHVGYNFDDADLLIATHWTTAEVANQARGTARKAYYVQDFEPWFHSAGVEYVAAERTYTFPMLCLTLGPWLARHLRERYGARAQHFDFAYDRSVYYPDDRPRPRKHRVAFYARPSTPRRATSLGLAALGIVHQVAPEVEIVLFGADDLNRHRISFRYVNAGILSPERLADLYRSSTVGLCLSCTNPSFIPFEMLACKCPVVEIRSDRVSGLLVHGSTAYLAEPTPEALADGILTLLDNDSLRDSIVDNGYELVKNWSWENSAKQVEEALLAEVEGRRVASSLSRDLISINPTDLKFLVERRALDVVQPDGSKVVGDICGQRVAGQSFICQEDGLYRIDVMATTYGGRSRGRIVLRLKHRADSTESIVTVETQAASIADGGWLSFRFAPILGSRLKAYYFSLEMPDAEPGEALGVCCSTLDFPDGTRFQNHVPLNGSLAFRTFVMNKQGRLTVSGEHEIDSVLELIDQHRAEDALRELRLAQSKAEKDLLVQHMLAAGENGFRGLVADDGIGLGVALSADQKVEDYSGLSYDGPRSQLPYRDSFQKRFVRGGEGTLREKAWLVLRHHGIGGLRHEIRHYLRWRLSR